MNHSWHSYLLASISRFGTQFIRFIESSQCKDVEKVSAILEAGFSFFYFCRKHASNPIPNYDKIHYSCTALDSNNRLHIIGVTIIGVPVHQSNIHVVTFI